MSSSTPSAPKDRPGLTINAGEHVCALYSGTEDRNRVLVPYLTDGLLAGHKCLVAVTDQDSSQMTGTIGPDVDVDATIAAHQLELRDQETPVTAPSEFSIDGNISFWDGQVTQALADGYPFVRLGAEAGWWMPQLPSVDDLISYESELNRFAGRYPQSILCMYDLTEFGGRLVVDLLNTHPRVLLSGLPFENPYYMSPDDFLATRRNGPVTPSA